MKGNHITVDAVPPAEAAKLTAANKYGAVWPAGLYIVVDNSRSVLESKQEVDDLISQLKEAAKSLWPE